MLTVGNKPFMLSIVILALTSAEDQKLQCFKSAENNIFLKRDEDQVNLICCVLFTTLHFPRII
jgi:hypothetical protein